MLLLSCRKR